MMPKLDGFELLAALRADPDLKDLPVILLSARAGVKAIDPRLLAGARGQEDDRQILQVRIGPQGRKQLESVELGHHDIRQH